MENSTVFLFWAYNTVWALLAGYLVFLGLRLRQVGRRLDRLERDTDRD